MAASKPRIQLTESEIVERGLVIVRLDPKPGARPGECDDLQVSDLAVTLAGRSAAITSVERVPRPVRHWLLLDVSESAEGRREEAKRSAEQYLREVMTPGVDSAAVLTIDEDPILLAGPSADSAVLAGSLERIPPGDLSALRDGLDVVLRQIQGDRHEHLVLYWTDGEDTHSLITPDELLAGLDRAPNATVFPIALLPKTAAMPKPPLTGPTFTEVARRSGGEVLISSDPRWLDRVRGWIGRRFTIAFVPPETADTPRGRRGLVIAVPGKRCQVTVLHDPFGRPDPVAGAAPPAPAALVRLRKGPRPILDTPCGGGPTDKPWDWPLQAERQELNGCTLDFVQSPGPYVVDGSRGMSYLVHQGHIVPRRIRILAPDVSRLATDPAEMIDTTTPDSPRAPTPFLMEGNALLAQRARIATSLFAERADYHDFALDRLRRFAEDELRAVELDLARAYPGMSRDEIAAAARASRAGRRAIEAARTPTDSDVARVLAAWIRDIPTAEVLEGVEKRLIDARIGSRTIGSLADHWTALRERFGMPSRVRIAAPLVLLRDPQQDVIGLVRIVLPRPERFLPPTATLGRGEKPIDGRLPLRPLALGLVDALAARAEVGAALAAGGYKASSLAYEPLVPLDRRNAMLPFTRARVSLTLEAPPRPGEPSPRVILDAGVDGSAASLAILRLEVRVTGDPPLAAMLREETVRYSTGQTPTELPTQVRPLLWSTP
jgi:hypothetical protein